MLKYNALGLQVIDFIGSNFRCSSNPERGTTKLLQKNANYHTRKSSSGAAILRKGAPATIIPPHKNLSPLAGIHLQAYGLRWQ